MRRAAAYRRPALRRRPRWRWPGAAFAAISGAPSTSGAPRPFPQAVDDVRDRDLLLRARRELDRIAGRDFAFAEDGEVEAAGAAGQEALDHVVAVEPHAQLETRHARVGDLELRGAHLEAVADPDLALEKA